MMKLKLNAMFLLLGGLLFQAHAYGAAEKKQEPLVQMITVNSFSQLQQAVLELKEESKQKNLSNTLIVMDDDDTLTMMECEDRSKPISCQFLGGPAWFSWQENLLKQYQSNHPVPQDLNLLQQLEAKNGKLTKQEKELKHELEKLAKESANTVKPPLVANNMGDLLDIAALLLAINNMPYTEEKEVPSVLKTLTKDQAKLLVLTARGTSNLSATESQFAALTATKADQKKGITAVSFQELIHNNALNGQKSGIASIAGPFAPCTQSTNARSVSYQEGVMYVAGQNKGEMLKCLLSKTDSGQIQNIFFIDDTLQNVVDVFSAFEGQDQYKVTAMHYTYLKKHKDAFMNEKALQDKANQRWEDVKASLASHLKNPTAISKVQ